MAKRAGATPAIEALRARTVRFEEFHFEHTKNTVGFGVEAAQKVGVDPHRVFKTLIVSVAGLASPHSLAVAVVPASGTLNLKAMAAALGHKHAELAAPAAAQRSSGYVRGGISPLGQRTTLPTIIDSSALAHEDIFVSGGKRGFLVSLSPGDLVAATGAQVAAIGDAHHPHPRAH